MNDLTASFGRSKQLLSASYSTLTRHPRLVAFPLLALGTAALITLVFLVAVIFRSTGHGLGDLAHWMDWLEGTGTAIAAPPKPLSVADYFGLAGAYLGMMFITTFLNVALYSQIIEALGGEPVSVSAGLRFGVKRIRSILLWSLFAGAVGLLLQGLERRFPWFGRLGSFLFGTVWSVASVFAIPVMVRDENPSPLALLRNSAATIRKTWGEGLVGLGGIGIVRLLASLVSLAVFAALCLLVRHTHYYALAPFFFLVFILVLAAISCAGSVATAIFRCALYIYATEGVVPEPYTPELMDAAWRVKK